MSELSSGEVHANALMESGHWIWFLDELAIEEKRMLEWLVSGKDEDGETVNADIVRGRIEAFRQMAFWPQQVLEMARVNDEPEDDEESSG